MTKISVTGSRVTTLPVMARMSCWLGCALSLGIAACVADEPAAPAEPDIIAKGAGGGGCPVWECGENSPVIANFGFHELDVNGAAINGFKIVSFTKDSVFYQANVKDGKLSGTANHHTTLERDGLVGAQFLIAHPSGQYQIKIVAVDSAVEYWARSLDGHPHYLESYQLEWTTIGGSRWNNVCIHAGDTLVAGGGINTFHTLLFEGDHIDPVTRTVEPGPMNVFTLGCAGSAPAKMALIAHTHSAEAAGYITTYPERRTALLMFSAVYTVGSPATAVPAMGPPPAAYPFTVAGQRLEFIDDKGWLTYAAAPNGATPSAIEARWGPNGAICWRQSRVNAHPTKASEDEFPAGVTASVILSKKVQPPPPCSDYDFTHFNEPGAPHAHLISANPF